MQGPQYAERDRARIVAEARAIERLFAAIERYLVASMSEPPPQRRGQGDAGEARRRPAVQGVAR